MTYFTNLLRTTAGACLLALAACGTEREAAMPVSDAPPAREQAAPAEPDPRIRPAPDTMSPGDAERLHRGPNEQGPVDLQPRLERRDPHDLEADLRRRSQRAPLWVA
jgi:hypothetical protein